MTFYHHETDEMMNSKMNQVKYDFHGAQKEEKQIRKLEPKWRVPFFHLSLIFHFIFMENEKICSFKWMWSTPEFVELVNCKSLPWIIEWLQTGPCAKIWGITKRLLNRLNWTFTSISSFHRIFISVECRQFKCCSNIWKICLYTKFRLFGLWLGFCQIKISSKEIGFSCWSFYCTSIRIIYSIQSNNKNKLPDANVKWT